MNIHLNPLVLLSAFAFTIALVAPQAMAGGCPPERCSFDTTSQCSQRPKPAAYANRELVTYTVDLRPTAGQPENGGCRDCHGDCRKNPVTFRVRYYDCKLFDLETGEFIEGTAGSPVYTKSVESEGEEADC